LATVNVEDQIITEPDPIYANGAYWAHRMDIRSEYKVRLVDELMRQAGVEWPRGAKIAEVGSGPGSFLIPLAEELHATDATTTFAAFDISPDAIAAGRAQGDAAGLPIEWHVGSAAQMSGSYDYVFVMDVLEHLENPAQFLRDLAGKSKYVVLHLPIEQSLGHMLVNRPTSAFERVAHLQFYSLETAKILLGSSPFQVVDVLFSAASKETFDPRRSTLIRLVKFIRYYAYRANPRLASIIAGGSTLWLLQHKPASETGSSPTSASS
jgi:SAM-dependent methyltransferase